MKIEEATSVLESEQRAGIGIIGCADIAVRRAVPAIRQSPFHLVAVASRSAAKAQEVAARAGCKAVAGYESLLESPEIAAVYIPLPNSEHARWARRALDAGKHVLIEKPAVSSRQVALELTELAAGSGLAVMENFAFLRHPQHDQAQALVADGAIGELRSFSGSFGIPPTDPGGIKYQAQLGGGSLWEVGCYPVRAAQAYLGDSARVLGASLSVDRRLGVDTSGSALLCDDAGVSAHCSFGLSHSYRSTYDVWGSEGRLVLEWAFTPSHSARPVLRLQQRDVETKILAPACDQFVNVFETFHDAVRDPGLRAVHRGDLVRQATLMEQVGAFAR
ncbi:Gfo/Idh/MocA family oxidoreductase [Streptomyces sp. NPDC001904]|uniref:Gfo/Idh/MocA family protein n=1 Tax=Streptomyces sp. NPDC001904 TaxID=3154531 RepID=UPI00332D7872